MTRRLSQTLDAVQHWINLDNRSHTRECNLMSSRPVGASAGRPPVSSACGVADGRRFGTLGCSAVIVPARFVSAGSVDRNVRPTIGGERFAPPVRKPLDDLQSGNAGHQVHFARGDEP